MIRRSLRNFHPIQQPWMTRQSYSHELVSVMTFPLALAMVEGGTMAALANKTFEVSPVLFATIMAAPMFANLSSFAWARLAQGRRKVRVITGLHIGVLAVVAGVALLPTTGPGPVLLTLLMIVARCLIAGIVTVRATVWRLNYPRHLRARLTSRLVLIHVLIIAGAPLLGYATLDLDPHAFRVLYPVSAAVALIGVIAYARIRLRGEKDLLRHETGLARRVNPAGEPGPIYESDPAEEGSGQRGPSVLSVLRDDRFFRHYLIWQFLSGLGMQMGEVAVVHLITERLTDGLRVGGWSVEYLTAIALSLSIPMLLAVLTMPLFARQFDRMHVAEFRRLLARWWVACQMVTYFGAWLAYQQGSSLVVVLVVIGVARVIQGVTRGGGMIAFNLGHNDFADRRLTTLYMGVNVSLAGIRGIVAAFLGMGLYLGWESRQWLGLTLTGFEGIGPHVFGVTTVLTLISLLGFVSLSRTMARNGQFAPAD